MPWEAGSFVINVALVIELLLSLPDVAILQFEKFLDRVFIEVLGVRNISSGYFLSVVSWPGS